MLREPLLKSLLNLLRILPAAALALMLGACTPTPAPDTGDDGDKLRIVASSFAPFDFARQITGELADVSLLLPPGTESHSFEPTPKDIINIGAADIFIYVGGESDEWVKTVLSSIDTSQLKVITLIDCVETKTEDIIEGMEDEGDSGGGGSGEDKSTSLSSPRDGTGSESGINSAVGERNKRNAEDPPLAPTSAPEIDEHVWTAPQNAKLIVERIAKACENADATNAETYKQNTAAYLTQLDELDAQFRQVVATAQRQTLVFGDRFPFRYFTDAYGLNYFAAFPGCSSQTEASAATVAFLVDKVRNEKIPVVLKIELSSGAIAAAIANETGAKVETLSSAHNVSRDDFDAGATYLSIMQQNLTALKNALN